MNNDIPKERHTHLKHDFFVWGTSVLFFGFNRKKEMTKESVSPPPEEAGKHQIMHL